MEWCDACGLWIGLELEDVLFLFGAWQFLWKLVVESNP